MTNEIKLEPKYTIEPTAPQYNFGFIASALGMIPVPEGVALRPEAIVMMEDGAPKESDGEEDEPDFDQPVTLIHFANQHSIELNAEQMAHLETFIKDAQKMMADAQRERALMNARTSGGNTGIANQILQQMARKKQ